MPTAQEPSGAPILLLRTRDEPLAEAIAVLAREAGWTTIRSPGGEPPAAPPRCVLTDLDSFQAEESDPPPGALAASVSFSDGRSPTLPRPFPEERFFALLAAARGEELSPRPVSALFFDGERFTLYGAPLPLTPRERQLLRPLYEAAGTPVSAAALARQIWGRESALGNLRVTLHSLRAKIAQRTDRNLLRSTGDGGILLDLGGEGVNAALHPIGRGDGASAH